MVNSRLWDLPSSIIIHRIYITNIGSLGYKHIYVSFGFVSLKDSNTAHKKKKKVVKDENKDVVSNYYIQSMEKEFREERKMAGFNIEMAS